jgi:hypothetical protein
MSGTAQLELPLVLSTTSGTMANAKGIPDHRASPNDVVPPTASSPHARLTDTLARSEVGERVRTHRQIISHHWECAVERIGSSTFTATLRSLRDPDDSEKEAEIPIDEVTPDDLELLEPGAIFYWTMGYDMTPAGTRTRFSLLKFRRLPAWTKKDLLRVNAEADALFEMFGEKDARDKAVGG